MRAWLSAAVTVVLVGLVLMRGSSRAEPPPAGEDRPIEKVIEALKKTPAMKSELASVRFAAEVLGFTTINAPIGSPLTSLGPWSDNSALLRAEQKLTTASLTPEQKKAASALLKEFGDSLPLSLRAFTLAQEGKKPEALAAWLDFGKSQTVSGMMCPGEHPMYSHRRVARLGLALKQASALVEKGGDGVLEPLKKAIDRASSCAASNTAVG